MTTIDDIVFPLFVRISNDKVDNCANVCNAISTVNLSVLFCRRMKKSLNIGKIIAMQIFLRLHSGHEVFLFAIENFSVKGINDRQQRFI